MENDFKTDLQLNEEELQEITGGCAICDAEMKVVQSNNIIAATAQEAAKWATNADAAEHLAASNRALQTNANLLKQMADRHK